MSNENQTAAEAYVASSLKRLHRSFNVTLYVAGIVLTIEAGYFYFMNKALKEGLTAIPAVVEQYRGDFDQIKELANKLPSPTEYSEKIAEAEGVLDKINEAEDPEGIANLISQRIVGEIDTQGYTLVEGAKDYLEANIDEIPAWVKLQVPKYAGRLESQVDLWIGSFCVATSEELGSTFDAFMNDNADTIREFSEATDDEATLNELDEELTEALASFMETTPIENHGTLKQQSDNFLERLKAANELIGPLATKDTADLTEEEKRLRKALALFVDKLYNTGSAQEN